MTSGKGNREDRGSGNHIFGRGGVGLGVWQKHLMMGAADSLKLRSMEFLKDHDIELMTKTEVCQYGHGALMER